MTEPSGPIVGWTVPQEEEARGGRRPLGELIGDLFGTYRRRVRPILWLALVIEGLATLLTLPFIALSVAQMAEYARQLWDAFWSFDPTGQAWLYVQLPPVATDPVLGAIGGLVSIVPLGSALLLAGAVSVLLVRPADRPPSPGDALRAVLRRWAPILLPVLVLGVGFALVSALSASLTASIDFRGGSALPRPEWLAFSLILGLAAPVLLGIAVYLAVRWAVAVPAIVVEGTGLRAGLARSTAMTRGRMVHVFLALLVVVVIYTIAGWLMAVVPLVMAIVLALAGADPLLAVPAALYVAGRVLIAPLPALLVALLYRDFREAEAAEGQAAGREAMDRTT